MVRTKGAVDYFHNDNRPRDVSVKLEDTVVGFSINS